MRCGAPVCAACTTRLDGVNHCHACLKVLGARGEERRTSEEAWPIFAVVLAGAGILGLSTAFMLLQGKLAP
jgi:hypothetical protein